MVSEGRLKCAVIEDTLFRIAFVKSGGDLLQAYSAVNFELLPEAESECKFFLRTRSYDELLEMLENVSPVKLLPRAREIFTKTLVEIALDRGFSIDLLIFHTLHTMWCLRGPYLDQALRLNKTKCVNNVIDTFNNYQQCFEITLNHLN